MLNRFRPAAGLLLALTLFLCAVPASAAPPGGSGSAGADAEAAVTPGLENFVKQAAFSSGLFSDVSPDNWSYSVIAACYEYGLMQGRGDVFDRTGRLTVAEALTMADRVHQIYREGASTLTNGEPWYQPYVEYALSAGLIRDGDFFSWSEPITRAGMAYLFSRTLPAEALSPIKQVDVIPDDGQIPERDRDAVWTLYRAGVLTGNDAFGTFSPDSGITRQEAAAIIARVALPDLRRADTLFRQITDGEISFCLPQGGELLSSVTDAGSTMYQTKGTGIVVDIHRQNDPALEGQSLTGRFPTPEAEKAALETRSGSAWLSDCVVTPVRFGEIPGYQAVGNYASDRFSYPMQVFRFISGTDLCRVLVTWNENTADKNAVELVRSGFTVGGFEAVAVPEQEAQAPEPDQPAEDAPQPDQPGQTEE